MKKSNSKYQKSKIKKGDRVLVTSGRDRGKEGVVEKVFPQKQLVLVPGVNLYKKHRKSQGENRPGEILTLPRGLDVAKVALICPKCKQQTRVGYRTMDGKKLRVCRKCDQDIDQVAKVQSSKAAKKNKKI